MNSSKAGEFLKAKDNPALLPVQIAYYTGFVSGKYAAGLGRILTFEEQYLTVRRSMRYNGTRHTTEVGTTKRNKVRTVDFCDTLAANPAGGENRTKRKTVSATGSFYHLNYYKEVKEKGRTYYEGLQPAKDRGSPEGCKEISLVCLRSRRGV